MLGPTAIRLDALFAVNFLFDLPLFWFAGFISWRKPPLWRVVLAALVGALTALPPAIGPRGEWFTSGAAVLLISLLLTLLLAWPCSPRQMVAVYGTLWVVLGAAGGVTMQLAERLERLPGLFTSTGLVAMGVLVTLVGLQMVWQAYRERKAVKAALRPVRVRLGGRAVQLTGLVDSGNSLRTPVSGRPVAIVEADRVRPCLPPGVVEAVSMGWDALAAIPPDWLSRCQIIPYTAVGSREGALLVLSPEEMAIWEGERWVAVAGVIGLTPHPLHPGGDYHALLSPAMLQEAEGR